MKKMFLFIILCFGFTFLQAQVTIDEANNEKIPDGLSSYTEIVPVCNQAIALNPNNAEVYINRGADRYKIRHYDDAIADYDKAIELDPKNAEAYCLRGLAKHFLGDKEGACSDWNKSGELGFTNAYINIKEYCN
jgi:tetratricopeptide (TPR) repeat protein